MDDYKAPTFLVIKSRVEQDLSEIAAVLRMVLAVMWAKVAYLLHLHLDWVNAQNSPLTCGLARLVDYGMLYSVDRLDATKAVGQIIVTGNIGAFALLDELLRGDNGLDYAVTAAVELVAGNNLVNVRCTTAGKAGNVTAGSKLTFIEPQPGVDSETTVDVTGLTGGEEQETVEPWRARIVDEWQVRRLRGGRSGQDEDYRAWAKQAHPSVTGALVFRGVLGIGTVLVKPICNGLDGRLPTQAIIDAVKAKLTTVAPATADWRVAAPNQHPINFNVQLNAGADSEQNRALMTAAAKSLVLSENSETSVLNEAEVNAALAAVTTQYTLVAPTGNIAVNTGAVFVFNSMVFS